MTLQPGERSLHWTDHGRRTAIVTGVLTLVYFCARAALKQADGPHGDFGIFYEAGRVFFERGTLYHLDNGSLLTFKYSPFAAMAMMWMSLLPVTVSRVLWVLADAAMMALVIAMVWRLAGIRVERRFVWLPITVTLVLTANYHLDQLQGGQVTWAILFLTTAAFYLLWVDRPLSAGVMLAIAISVKLVPLCFVPFFMLRRRWIKGLVALAVTSIVLVLLPALWLGWSQNLELHAQWPRHLIEANDPTVEGRTPNLSVLSVLLRWFGGYGYGGGLTALPRETIRIVWLVLGMIGAAAIYGWCHLSLRAPYRYTGIRCFSVLLIFMTLFNPNAWRINFLALIVPLLVVFASYVEAPRKPWRQSALLALGIALQYPPVEGAQALPLVLLQDYGGRTLGALLILVVFLLVTGGLRPTQQIQSEASLEAV